MTRQSAIRNGTSIVEKIVVIAASAGGIDALIQVLSDLPIHLPVAILIVQHLRSVHQTRLPELLAQHCSLRVCLAQDGMLLQPRVVYLAVPGWHLRVRNGYLFLDLAGPVNYVRPSADILFASAGRVFGPNVIGIVLSGTGCDGARGCREIKAEGGVTIAQDAKTSRHFAMPKAAIDTGAVDYVLPLREIAGKIVSLAQQE